MPIADLCFSHFETVCRLFQHQFTSIRQKMDALLGNFSLSLQFVPKNVITVRTKKRVAGAEVCWRDNTSHVVEIVHRTDDSTVWFTWEVENLTRLIDEVADQVNMSAPLPNRTWHPSV